MDFDKSAELFKALGDPGRLKILALLQSLPRSSCVENGKVCGCDLIDLTGLSQPTVSHHMKVLAHAGLVISTKRGRWTDYALNEEGMAYLQSLLSDLHLLAPPSQVTEASQPPRSKNASLDTL